MSISQNEIVANEQLITDCHERVLLYLQEHQVEIDKMGKRSIRNAIKGLMRTIPDLRSMSGEEIANNLVGIAAIDTLRMQLMQEEDIRRNKEHLKKKEQEKKQMEEKNAPAPAVDEQPPESPDAVSPVPKVEEPDQDAVISPPEKKAKAKPSGKAPSRTMEKEKKDISSSAAIRSLYKGREKTYSQAELRKMNMDYGKRIKKLRSQMSNTQTYLNLYCEDRVILSAIPSFVKKNEAKHPDLVRIPGYDLSSMKGVFRYAMSCMMDDMTKRFGEDSPLFDYMLQMLDEENARQQDLQEQLQALLAEYEQFRTGMLLHGEME